MNSRNTSTFLGNAMTRTSMIAVNRLGKRIGMALWIMILMGSMSVSVTWAREGGPETKSKRTVGSVVEKAKAHVLNQVRQSITTRDLLWYNPKGLLVVIGQSGPDSLAIESVSLAELDKAVASHRYSPKASAALQSGGVHRIFSTERIESDLVIKALVTAIDSEQNFSAYRLSMDLSSIQPKNIIPQG